ncbi:MAG TPA: hypothetical protein VFW80_06765 [Gaiellaceae bacterium]|nr:hypothetical protein [Gaiellaceae bacterium]
MTDPIDTDRIPNYLIVVAPLKAGKLDRVRELLAKGPPFELDKTAFARHSVHVTDQEAVFIFEAEGRPATLALTEDDARVLPTDAWMDCLASRPRVARTAFTWQRGVRDS